MTDDTTTTAPDAEIDPAPPVDAPPRDEPTEAGPEPSAAAADAPDAAPEAAAAAEPAPDPAAGGTIPAAGGSGLAIRMSQAHIAEEQARAAEGVLSFGFDQGRAWSEIAHLNERVAAALAEWNRCKANTKDAKDEYDDAVSALTHRINDLENERRKPKLDLSGTEPLTNAAATDGRCKFERETGQTCYVCRRPGPRDLPAVDDPAHPDHEAHAQAAADAAVQAFVDRVATCSFFLEPAEVSAMDLTVRASIEEWVKDTSAIVAAMTEDERAAAGVVPPPEVFARKAHIAGHAEFGSGYGQSCTRCGRMLLDDVDLADEGSYPVGAYVGLDCDGAVIITRPTAKRGRTKKNRANPEAERAAQLQAGREAAAAETDAPDLLDPIATAECALTDLIGEPVATERTLDGVVESVG